MSKWNWLSHSILLRESVFEGYIINIEPLRVGAGREPSLGAPVDLALLRINYNGTYIPYIPGSSIKGVFRNYATLLAKYSGLKVCTGLSKKTCGKLETVDDKKLDRHIDELMKSGNKKAIEDFYNVACLMCKIFGSTRYMSNVFFSDAYPVDEDGRIIDINIDLRPGVAIDRRKGAAQRHGLYRVEFVEPSAKFKFSIRCRNLPNYAIGLLSQVLKRMNEGLIKIGGFKSRGFGAVKIDDLRFRSRDFVKEPSLVMASIEPGEDMEVALAGVAELKDSWVVAEGDKVWKALDRLIEAWSRYVDSQSHKGKAKR